MLYRYLDAEGLEATIRTQSLRLAKISSLNDPFDFNPGIKLKEVNNDKLRKIYQLNLVKHHFDVSKMSDSELRKDWSLRETNFKSSIREIANEYFGVISFSKLHDNPLLWAHYAKKHQGANIGFHIEQPPFSHMKKRDFLVDVFYQKDRPIFYHHPLDEDSSHEQLKSVMQIKSDIWSYEKEVRAILPIHDLSNIELRFFEEDGYCYLRMRPNEWKEIRFGISTQESLIQEIMNLAREKGMTGCRFFKAFLKKYEYYIKFEPIQ